MGRYENGRYVSDDPMQRDADENGGYLPGAREAASFPVLNTDRELWRERPDDHYADSLFVTEGGGIGMNCGGNVVVMPIRQWFALAGFKKPETKD